MLHTLINNEAVLTEATLSNKLDSVVNPCMFFGSRLLLVTVVAALYFRHVRAEESGYRSALI